MSILQFTPRLIAFLLIAGGASAQAIRFERLPDDVLARRLDRIQTTNGGRLRELEKIFVEAGCGERLSPQTVKGSKLPNLLCTVPGRSEESIVVGAHYDFAGLGTGAIDNWSGASLLPSLFQSFSAKPRHYSVIFVGFTDEEHGLVGSRYFVKEWFRAKRPKIAGMINLDSLGTGPTKVWVSRADRQLVSVAATIAKALNVEVAGVDVDQVGDSDSKEFVARKVPVIDIHSISQETLPLLHSAEDTRERVHFPSYRDSYLLVLGMLEYLDAGAAAPPPR